ncbi:MaoC family dehydratase [Sandaracinobacteroides saxicola]|uniref:MaoC family dehydratase n=1 Tax=Sandaracinobacteroides saxicola TaxID=2759707 RepID=A0A7G5IF97_9SPHN|nr:MaoC family dehydratase [Sandaracinobacteroides saxicola]QMW22039.1 MaoC family dehydratase [Sandaracinobacteroides saxicola]
MLYFEDYAVGQVRHMGPYTLTREEALDFARKYDPQPFHLDDEAAAAHPFFGRISASGWHVCAMAMRMIVDSHADAPTASLGSPGVDKVRWLKPVYPGDTLHMEVEVESVRASRSRPEMGMVNQHYRLFNQHGVLVMTMEGVGLFRTRPA